MPILALIMGFIAYFVAKKNKLLSKRKPIFYLLLIAVILCLPALLGFIPYAFMPYIYIALQILYLILGYYTVLILRRYMLGQIEKKNSFPIIFFFQFLIMFIGAALFSTVFNMCSELKYGIWACTCLLPLLFPPLFWETYNRYMSIPLEVYKIWEYKTNDQTVPTLTDYNSLLVMEIELYKTLTDPFPMKIKAKAPPNIAFGPWFKTFITDHNYKFPSAPIVYTHENDGAFYSWIFYIKRSFFVPRKYIDHELTIPENKIKEKHTIVAKRIIKQANEDKTKNLNK
jgi:hypothetical protein